MRNQKGDISFNLYTSSAADMRSRSRHPVELTLDDLNDIDNKLDEDQDREDEGHFSSANQSEKIDETLQARHQEGRTVNFDTATFENSEEGQSQREFSDHSQSIRTQFEFSARPAVPSKQVAARRNSRQQQLETNNLNQFHNQHVQQRQPTNNNNNNHQGSYWNDESDFDLSETKLQRLGMISSIDKEKQKYSNLLMNYSKQFHNDSQSSEKHASQTQASAGYQLSGSSPYSQHTVVADNNNSGGFHSRENSRLALGKYGHVLQREQSHTPGTPASTFVSSNTQPGLHERLSPGISSSQYTPASSTFLSNMRQNHQDRSASPISHKDSLRQLQHQQQYQINYDIYSGKSEAAYQQMQHPNIMMNNSGNQQGIASQYDAYRLSIHSFKNSLFSESKENINFPQEAGFGGLLRGEASALGLDPAFKEGTMNAATAYDPMQHFGMSSNEVMRSALQMHHLAGSDKVNAQQTKAIPNHPVYNMAKVFGDSVRMNQEFKKQVMTREELSDKEPFSLSLARGQSTMGSIQTRQKSDAGFEEAKNKYYDTFLPEKEKIMSNPLKLFKQRIFMRDQETLQGCQTTLAFIEKEIDNNVQPELEKSIYARSLARSSSSNRISGM